MRTKTICRGAFVAGFSALALSLTALPAYASQPSDGPWVPDKKKGKIVSQATMNSDCKADLECHTYFKIEKRDSGGWGGWKDVTGKWISGKSGKQTLSGTIDEGCNDYRAAVLDFQVNKKPGDTVRVGGGVGADIKKQINANLHGEYEHTFEGGETVRTRPYFSEPKEICSGSGGSRDEKSSDRKEKKETKETKEKKNRTKNRSEGNDGGRRGGSGDGGN